MTAEEIGIGMLGYGFMGRAHAHAYRTLSAMTWPPPLLPRLVAVAGRDEAAVSETARRFGFAGHVTDWRLLITDWGAAEQAAWRFDRAAAGSGALGDLGSHLVDLARYLVGEIDDVSAELATFWPGREVDDAVAATVRFAGGAVGTIEASRFATGRKSALRWEINGDRGSIAFDLERLNELQVHLAGSAPGARAQGFRTVLVTEPDHPFLAHRWPPGHIIGWEHTFVHELHHLLTAIRDDADVAPHGATLRDGYRAAEVCDAMSRSSASGRREPVTYRG